MRIVIDTETNSLVNPSKIWCIVCKDIDTGQLHIFRGEQDEIQSLFRDFWKSVTLCIGHNWLGYDYPVLVRLLGIDWRESVDTLIISKLVDYPRDGHSIEDYGVEFGLPKGGHLDFTKWSQELEDYCIRDVEIGHKVYLKYLKYLSNPNHKLSIDVEHKFQLIVNKLSTDGFSFNIPKANTLLAKVKLLLEALDKEILKEFPARLKMTREITPKATKYGTISLSSIPKALRPFVHEMNVDAPFCYCSWTEFNPSSHKQIVDVLNESGWRPVDKTKTHIETEREISKLKRLRNRGNELDIRLQECYLKIKILEKSGWKVNETNLETLPKSAPPSARSLAQRILLEARRRTLTEWLELADPTTSRIHGKFYAIGAWTHRMAHQAPNTANIPNEFQQDGSKKLLGKELRSLWQAPKNRLLVGCDAEGIQLRIFAHYIDDPEFIDALVQGKKENKSDPHSLNQRILGDVCKTRQAAKRYIYALLLGAGRGKLQEILSCSSGQAEEAYERLIERYTGFAHLKKTIIPADARRGWFTGLDGRRVRIYGDTAGEREHLCMSGYLQNGEAVVMKHATIRWFDKLSEYDSFLVNFVHDEWQTETPNDMKIALEVAHMQAESLRLVGEELNIKCPLAGSYWNDDHHDYTISTNWSLTH